MRKIAASLLISLTIISIVTFQKAQADCSAATTGDDVITCTGIDNNGTDAGAGHDQVIIEANSTVSGAFTIYTAAGNDSVTNNGTVNGQDGINTGLGNDYVINNGTVNANPYIGIQLAWDDDTAINNGTITANHVGIDGYSGNDVIENNGTITTNGYGISSGYGQDTVINNGTIVAGNTGIHTTTLPPYCCGYGAGANPGTDTIVNTGTVVAGNIGVDLYGAATVYNSGDIEGGMLAIWGSNASETVVNEGTLTSNGVYAVKLEGGNDTFITAAGTEVNGVVHGGAGIDNFALTYTFESEDFFIPAEYEAIRQQLLTASQTCDPAAPCTIGITVNGLFFAYTYQGFETLDSFLRFIKVTFTPYEAMPCQNGIRCFALKDKAFRNGNVQIYAADGDTGVGVATVNFLLLGEQGYSYSNPENGWTVEIAYAGTEGDARLYTITLSQAGEVRQAGLQVMAFAYRDTNPATHALAWR